MTTDEHTETILTLEARCVTLRLALLRLMTAARDQSQDLSYAVVEASVLLGIRPPDATDSVEMVVPPSSPTPTTKGTEE
jgi:hypothetical protein